MFLDTKITTNSPNINNIAVFHSFTMVIKDFYEKVNQPALLRLYVHLKVVGFH